MLQNQSDAFPEHQGTSLRRVDGKRGDQSEVDLILTTVCCCGGSGGLHIRKKAESNEQQERVRAERKDDNHWAVKELGLISFTGSQKERRAEEVFN